MKKHTMQEWKDFTSKKRTMKEWRDFTQSYIAKDATRVCSFEQRPHPSCSTLMYSIKTVFWIRSLKKNATDGVDITEYVKDEDIHNGKVFELIEPNSKMRQDR